MPSTCGRCHHQGRPPRRCVESMTMGRSRCVQASPRACGPLALGPAAPAPCRHRDRSPHLLGRHARCFDEDSTCPTDYSTFTTPRKRTLCHQEIPCPHSTAIQPLTCPEFDYKSDCEPCSTEESDYCDDDDFVVRDCATQTRGSSCNQKKNIVLTRNCPTMTEPCTPMLTKTTITSRPSCPLSSPSCCLEPKERKRRVCRKSSKKPRWLVSCSSQTEKTCVGGAECSVCTETDTATAEGCTGTSCDAMNENTQVCIPADFAGILAFSPSEHGTTCKDDAKIERGRSSCASCNTENVRVNMSCSTSRKSVSFNPSCCSINDRKRTGPRFSCTGDKNQSSEQSDIETDEGGYTCLCSLKDTKGNAKKCMSCKSDEDNMVYLCKKKETMNSACSNVMKSVSSRNSEREGGSSCCCKLSDYFMKDNDDSKQCECVYPPAYSQYGCTGNLSGNCSCGPRPADKPSNK